MTNIARIDDTDITSDDLIRHLKLNDKFDQFVEELVAERVVLSAAQKMGIAVRDDEVQEESDTMRRALSLHSAKDTLDFLGSINLDFESFETHLQDTLARRKVMETICSDDTIQNFFELHSPKFESVEVSTIVVESEGKALEVIATLQDEPEEFDSLARALSLDSETGERGGQIGTVLRGGLQDEVEAKVFNAELGEPLGPFLDADSQNFEIYMVTNRISARLDDPTRTAIARILYEQWLDERLQDHSVQVL